MKTSQENRRENIISVLKSVLDKDLLLLNPHSIVVKDSAGDQNTMVDFSFLEMRAEKSLLHSFDSISGKGFVDCLFETCLDHYSQKYSSLAMMSLEDFLVEPIFSTIPSSHRSGAKTDVILKVRLPEMEISVFRSTSRSIVYSGFSTILSAFEFYINCQKAFDSLTFAIADAKSRQRPDIVSSCKYKLSEITSVNRYEKKQY